MAGPTPENNSAMITCAFVAVTFAGMMTDTSRRQHVVHGPLGDEFGVTGALLNNNKTGLDSTINIHGFFLAIGHHPNAEVFKPYINTDEQGYIITDTKTQKTNIDGVFAAGDVQDPIYRQAIAAAGSGCKAAMDVEKFLQEN